jgi:hypothetical protein
MAQFTQNEERAIAMLGSGIPASQVALALGLTESAVSQWFSQDSFANAVQDLKFQNLSRNTKIDDTYLDLEEQLQAKLQKVLPLMTKPRDVVMALSAINSTKRRGAQIQDPNSGKSAQIVNLSLPSVIVNQYISNSNNQIVEVRDDVGRSQSLITAASSSLDRLSEEILGKGNSGQELLIGRDGSKEESNNVPSQELLQQLSAALLPARSPEGRGSQKTNVRETTVQDL